MTLGQVVALAAIVLSWAIALRDHHRRKKETKNDEQTND